MSGVSARVSSSAWPLVSLLCLLMGYYIAPFLFLDLRVISPRLVIVTENAGSVLEHVTARSRSRVSIQYSLDTPIVPIDVFGPPAPPPEGCRTSFASADALHEACEAAGLALIAPTSVLCGRSPTSSVRKTTCEAADGELTIDGIACCGEAVQNTGEADLDCDDAAMVHCQERGWVCAREGAPAPNGTVPVPEAMCGRGCACFAAAPETCSGLCPPGASCTDATRITSAFATVAYGCEKGTEPIYGARCPEGCSCCAAAGGAQPA